MGTMGGRSEARRRFSCWRARRLWCAMCCASRRGAGAGGGGDTNVPGDSTFGDVAGVTPPVSTRFMSSPEHWNTCTKG